MQGATQFIGGDAGHLRIVGMKAIKGQPLAQATHIDKVATGRSAGSSRPAWLLRGIASNVRYATRGELDDLRRRQEPLGRASATMAALIPIKKSSAWWDLAQDERRAIFEEQSRHTAIGLRYLPAIARQLYHSRDLGEPFDFLTWFEFAPADAVAFDDLLAALRATQEWHYVEREIDIRLQRD